MASQMQQLSSYLPPGHGGLPMWLLFIGVVSLGNSISSYVSTASPREVYAGSRPIHRPSVSSGSAPTKVKEESKSPVTELSARTFGTWTALSSIVRLYAAYHIYEPAVYDLALWTFGLAFAHFFSEWLVYGTARWSRGLAMPVLVATGSSAWMLAVRSTYVQ